MEGGYSDRESKTKLGTMDSVPENDDIVFFLRHPRWPTISMNTALRSHRHVYVSCSAPLAERIVVASTARI